MDQPTVEAAHMVRDQLRSNGIKNESVLDAMLQVPRHRFLAESQQRDAYSDRPLPTAEGQTISQPYIVARMTELLRLEPGLRVLEIGTGSGYQTAILAHLGANVTSVESRPALAERARQNLQSLGYSDRVNIVVGDGSLGYPPAAPYNRILVTAGAPDLPEPYREQLTDEGRIVIPIGSRELQYLTTFDRRGDNWTHARDIPCRFVPLVGAAGWAKSSLV